LGEYGVTLRGPDNKLRLSSSSSSDAVLVALAEDTVELAVEGLLEVPTAFTAGLAGGATATLTAAVGLTEAGVTLGTDFVIATAEATDTALAAGLLVLAAGFGVSLTDAFTGFATTLPFFSGLVADLAAAFAGAFTGLAGATGFLALAAGFFAAGLAAGFAGFLADFCVFAIVFFAGIECLLSE